MTHPVVHLDKDGVLANFVDHMLAAHGADRSVIKQDWRMERWLGITNAELWAPIDVEWWATLPKYSWADELIKELSRFGRVIVTTSLPPKAGLPDDEDLADLIVKEAAIGKIEWFRRHGIEDYMLVQDKGHLGAHHKLLVDDSSGHVAAFRLEGGKAVLFPHAWNGQNVSDPLKHVMRQVEKLCTPL